ncbi:hypothetical protein GCM10020000_67150 [Streptomyces olivoverticillatus]
MTRSGTSGLGTMITLRRSPGSRSLRTSPAFSSRLITPVMAPEVSPETSASSARGDRLRASREVQALQVGGVDGQPVGDGLVEEDGLTAEAAHLPGERSDEFFPLGQLS